jgi:hypothetical protein
MSACFVAIEAGGLHANSWRRNHYAGDYCWSMMAGWARVLKSTNYEQVVEAIIAGERHCCTGLPNSSDYDENVITTAKQIMIISLPSADFIVEEPIAVLVGAIYVINLVID